MIINGEAIWAKIVGEPQPGYDKTKKEWSIDVKVDAATKKLLAKEGIGNKVKMSKDGEYEYISFKRPGFKKDPQTGELVPSKPIRIVGPDTQPWPPNVKIGNGSIVNVSFLINEVPYNGNLFKKPGILAVQVVKHVPYETRGDDFEPVPVDANGAEDWSQA